MDKKSQLDKEKVYWRKNNENKQHEGVLIYLRLIWGIFKSQKWKLLEFFIKNLFKKGCSSSTWLSQ